MELLDKKVLDPCCGSKMFYFDKQNPDVVFGDVRKEKHILCDGRALDINPDVLMDFRAMPFPDGSFHHVVFDPPHLPVRRQPALLGWQLQCKQRNRRKATC